MSVEDVKKVKKLKKATTAEGGPVEKSKAKKEKAGKKSKAEGKDAAEPKSDKKLKKRSAEDIDGEISAKKAKKAKTNTPQKLEEKDEPMSDVAKELVASATDTMTDEEYRKKHEIAVIGDTVPTLHRQFSDTPFPESVIKAFTEHGFSNPSPIQAQSWPIALTGRDCLSIAKTGSGKTCGYLLPAFMEIKKTNFAQRKASDKDGPYALVMAPTRELAIQIQEEAEKFGKPCGVRSIAVYGGASKGPQIRELKFGTDIIVATPGRLLDFSEMKNH
ncbi:hypothetical protein CYMTET_46951, partial [Cymbomonas tetramitiformis]